MKRLAQRRHIIKPTFLPSHGRSTDLWGEGKQPLLVQLEKSPRNNKEPAQPKSKGIFKASRLLKFYGKIWQPGCMFPHVGHVMEPGPVPL